MKDFLEKKANWLFDTILSGLPFEYVCKDDPDNNGYLRTEWGVVFKLSNAPRKLNGSTIIITDYEVVSENVTVVHEWSKKLLKAVKKPEIPFGIPNNIKMLFDIVNNNKVVKDDISRWFYDNKNFSVNDDNFGAFIKFIVKEIIFFAKHGDIPFEINYRERRWFVELFINYLNTIYANNKK